MYPTLKLNFFALNHFPQKSFGYEKERLFGFRNADFWTYFIQYHILRLKVIFWQVFIFIKEGSRNVIIFSSESKRIAQFAFNTYFGIILQDLVDFISLECVISLREAFFFDRNCKLKTWQILRIRLLLVFQKTNRYLAKRTMQHLFYIKVYLT